MDLVVKRDKWVKLDEQGIPDRKVISVAKAKKVQLVKRDPEENEDRLGLMASLVGLALTTGMWNQGPTGDQ